ncbi:MAG: RAMP superfamily CRISPR-associated protein [Candidatus Eremiobacterota bacterium]
MCFEKINTLEVRLYEIITKSNLHIGGGESLNIPSPIDNPVSRIFIINGDKKTAIPWIPPTSFRGKARSWLERELKSTPDSNNLVTFTQSNMTSLDNLLKTYYPNRNNSEELSDKAKEVKKEIEKGDIKIYKDVCNFRLPFDECQKLSGDNEKEKQQKVFINEFELIRPGHTKNPTLTNPCNVCSLFGYSGEKSRIRFVGGYPCGKYIENHCPSSVIDRIAIERHTQTALDSALFHEEVVPPGVTFYMFILIEEPNEYDRKYVDWFINGIRREGIGAGSVYGEGYVDITLKDTQILKEKDWKNLQDISSSIKDKSPEDFFFSDLPKIITFKITNEVIEKLTTPENNTTTVNDENITKLKKLVDREFTKKNLIAKLTEFKFLSEYIEEILDQSVKDVFHLFPELFRYFSLKEKPRNVKNLGQVIKESSSGKTAVSESPSDISEATVKKKGKGKKKKKLKKH